MASAKHDDETKMIDLLYQCSNWQYISPEVEANLERGMKKLHPYSTNAAYQINSKTHSLQRAVADRVGHLYLKQGELAKSFLLHNPLENLEETASLELLESVLFFLNKKNKNKFEELLMSRTQDLRNNYKPIEYVNFLIGMFHLQQRSYTLAIDYFKDNDIGSTFHLGIESHISRLVFSNGTKAWQNGQNRRPLLDIHALKDSVYLDPIFELNGQNSLSRLELSQVMLNLTRLTKSDTIWHKKLAFYLMANYYFNTSIAGYLSLIHI